jgi:hypothetical protein
MLTEDGGSFMVQSQQRLFGGKDILVQIRQIDPNLVQKATG